MSESKEKRESGLGIAAAEWMQTLVDWIEEALPTSSEADPFDRDPEFVASMWPLLKASNLYFGSEVRGWENVPRDEPVLFVGNHSGGMMTMDPMPLMLRWIEAFGCERPIYGLTYDLLFANETMASMLRRMGCLPASHDNARRALAKGASVIVFPGGDYEVFRPWRERNEIQFGGRMGFIELAISCGVRVVPMTIHGAHESTFVLTRGHHIAHRIGLDRLRVKVFPFVWNIPFGPGPAFLPSIPLPTKVTVELGAPLDWTGYGRESAEDPEVLQRCYDEITGTMQRSLTRLAEERPYPLLSRVGPATGLSRWLPSVFSPKRS